MERHRHAILVQSGLSHAMPPGNVSAMEERERAAVVRWALGAHP
jgi:uncharacterized membrane protein